MWQMKLLKIIMKEKQKKLWTDKEEGSSVIYEQLDYSDEEAFFLLQIKFTN